MTAEALGLVETLAALELEGNALRSAELGDNLGGNAGASDRRSTNLDAATFTDKESFEGDDGIQFGIELLDVDLVSLLNAVLLTACFDHCVGHGRKEKGDCPPEIRAGGEITMSCDGRQGIFFEIETISAVYFCTGMEWTARNEEEMVNLGKKFAQELEPGSVIALVGGLGAGKTHWTKGAVAGLGHEGQVTSPTFSLVHEYQDGRLPVYHFDFYRLESAQELIGIGWDEFLEEPGVVIAEWADLFPELLPAHALWLKIEPTGDGGRRIFNLPQDG
jgi:tRNA threonylcarbamoyladenosine biosynthesis protein TsaE